MNPFNIEGKKAIVTGASRGLGRGVLESFLNAGAEVAAVATTQGVEQMAGQYRAAGYRCHGAAGDFFHPEELERVFRQALGLLGGKLDILVNCAGIQRRRPCEEFPMEDWQAVLDINLTATFRMCQLAAGVMLPAGQGKIINFASMLSFFGGYTVPAYAASKGGVAQLTKALSNEWAGRGVNVNAIAPGYMDTEMNTALIADAGRNQKILARIPAGRWGTAQDVGGAAVFLASPASDYLTGAVIPVDGGYLSC